MPTLRSITRRSTCIQANSRIGYSRSPDLRYCPKGDLMTPQELKQAIYDSSLPASEASRLVDSLDSCPHFIEGCCAIEVCENEPVLDYDAEPF